MRISRRRARCRDGRRAPPSRRPGTRRGRPSSNALNDPMGRLIGTTTVLETAIVNGHGRARVADGAWNVTGPDLPEGTPVRIVAVTRARLTVEPV